MTETHIIKYLSELSYKEIDAIIDMARNIRNEKYLRYQNECNHENVIWTMNMRSMRQNDPYTKKCKDCNFSLYMADSDNPENYVEHYDYKKQLELTKKYGECGFGPLDVIEYIIEKERK